MSYSIPNRMTYSLGLFDFGGGANETTGIQGPTGKIGRITDITVQATEVFTTGGAVRIGVSGDDDKHVDFEIGTLADNGCVSLRGHSDPDAIKDADLPADTLLLVTLVATTGTPTGQGYVTITIDWAD